LAPESASIGTRRQRGCTRLPLTTDARRSCRELAVLRRFFEMIEVCATLKISVVRHRLRPLV